MFKNPAEYAAALLDFTGGNRLLATKTLFEAEQQFRLPQSFVADVFNVITGN